MGATAAATQTELDQVNTAITAILGDVPVQEYWEQGDRVRFAELTQLFAERSRLEKKLARQQGGSGSFGLIKIVDA